MLYIFILYILTFSINITSGPTCSRPKIHVSTPVTSSQIKSKLYFAITVKEFNKEEYNEYIEKYAQNSNLVYRPLTPLTTLTATFLSTKDSHNKPCHGWTKMETVGNIQLFEEERIFINNMMSMTSSPGNIIHCKPIHTYTLQPNNSVRYMTVSCSHDLNPNFQASDS